MPHAEAANSAPHGLFAKHCAGGTHAPLMLDRIVALATLVKPSAALPDQFATNQKKQKMEERWIVSRTVSGGSAADWGSSIPTGTYTVRGG